VIRSDRNNELDNEEKMVYSQPNQTGRSVSERECGAKMKDKKKG
jgi:hypothetical protein